MLITTLTLCSALLGPQQPAPACRLLPLAPLLEPTPQRAPLAWGTLLTAPTTDQDLLGASETTTLAASDVLDLLRTLHRGELDDEQLVLQSVAGALLVAGSSDAVAQATATTNALTATLARPVTIEFAVWPLGDEASPGAMLDADAYARFATEHQHLLHARSSSVVGRTVQLERYRFSRYNRSNSVEVAAKTARACPAPDSYAEGGLARIHTEALLEDHATLVHVQFALGERRGDVAGVTTGIPGHPMLEQPVLASSFAICSARVPNGGALCCTLRGTPDTGGSHAVTVRVVASPEPPPLQHTNMSLLPIGSLMRGGLDRRPKLRPTLHTNRFAFHFDFELEPEPRPTWGHFDADQLIEMAYATLTGHPDCTGQESVRVLGDHLLVIAPDGARAAVTALLRDLQDRVCAHVEVDHVEAQQGAAARDGGRELCSVRLPTLYGRQFAALRLLEQNTIDELWLEVASEAGILTPGVVTVQSGAFMRGSIAPLDGQLMAELDVHHQHAELPPPVDIVPGGGSMVFTRMRHTNGDHRGLLPPSGVVEHGGGARADAASTMRTRVRR